MTGAGWLSAGAATTALLVAAPWRSRSVPPAGPRRLWVGAARRRPENGGAPAGRSSGAAAAGAAALFLAGVGSGATVASRLVSGLGFVLVGIAARSAVRRISRRRRARAVAAAVPDLVDLFVVAASAGHPVPSCLRAVAERAPPLLRPALVQARDRLGRGEPLAVALNEAGSVLGSEAGPLVEALVDSHRTGSPLLPSLDRAAVAARDIRRRRAEERARRLPVTLLFPLVCCVLPAFGLLAVVPLLVASLGSLAG